MIVRRDILLGGFARIFISESEVRDMKGKIIQLFALRVGT